MALKSRKRTTAIAWFERSDVAMSAVCPRTKNSSSFLSGVILPRRPSMSNPHPLCFANSTVRRPVRNCHGQYASRENWSCAFPSKDENVSFFELLHATVMSKIHHLL